MSILGYKTQITGCDSTCTGTRYCSCPCGTPWLESPGAEGGEVVSSALVSSLPCPDRLGHSAGQLRLSQSCPPPSLAPRAPRLVSRHTQVAARELSRLQRQMGTCSLGLQALGAADGHTSEPWRYIELGCVAQQWFSFQSREALEWAWLQSHSSSSPRVSVADSPRSLCKAFP